MDSEIREIIQRLHDSPGRIALVTAGAGTAALSWLLGVAGASRTVMEALVPYGKPAFDDFLGRSPEKYVAQQTVQWMAGRALTRARLLADEGERTIGLACTATVVTDRPKKGDHRAHIAAWSNERVITYYLILAKGKRDRQGEEDVVSRVILNTLAEAYGINERVEVPWLEGDTLEPCLYEMGEAVDKLYSETVPYFGVHDYGRIRYQDARPQVLLPGSFNPLHDGHLGLALAASSFLGKPIAFELSAFNVDKPPIAAEAALARVAQFAGRWPIYVTNAPTFLEKARIFAGATFIVGYDTASRILMPRYYGNSIGDMLEALTEIRSLGCHFLVASRLEKNGRFYEATQLPVPSGLDGLFVPLPDFRHDISSTELRQKGLKGSR